MDTAEVATGPSVDHFAPRTETSLDNHGTNPQHWLCEFHTQVRDHLEKLSQDRAALRQEMEEQQIFSSRLRWLGQQIESVAVQKEEAEKEEDVLLAARLRSALGAHKRDEAVTKACCAANHYTLSQFQQSQQDLIVFFFDHLKATLHSQAKKLSTTMYKRLSNPTQESELKKGSLYCPKQMHKAVAPDALLLARQLQEVTWAVTFLPLVAEELSTETDDRSKVQENNLLLLQHQVFQSEAALSQATEAWHMASARLEALVKKQKRIEIRLQQCRESKTAATARSDFQTAVSCLNHIADLGIEFQGIVGSVAEAQGALATADEAVRQQETQMQECVSEKENLAAHAGMERLSGWIRRLVQITKRCRLEVDLDSDSIQAVTLSVLLAEIRSLEEERQSLGGKFGGSDVPIAAPSVNHGAGNSETLEFAEACEVAQHSMEIDSSVVSALAGGDNKIDELKEIANEPLAASSSRGSDMAKICINDPDTVLPEKSRLCKPNWHPLQESRPNLAKSEESSSSSVPPMEQGAAVPMVAEFRELTQQSAAFEASMQGFLPEDCDKAGELHDIVTEKVAASASGVDIVTVPLLPEKPSERKLNLKQRRDSRPSPQALKDMSNGLWHSHRPKNSPHKTLRIGRKHLSEHSQYQSCVMLKRQSPVQFLTAKGPSHIARHHQSCDSAWGPRCSADVTEFQPESGIEADSYHVAPAVALPLSSRQPMLLSMPSDMGELSDLHCFVRQHIEVFAVTTDDVYRRKKPRGTLNHVGLRCVHCAKLPFKHQAENTVCFPSALSGIYRAVMRMISNHFSNCPGLPPADQRRFKSLQQNSCPRQEAIFSRFVSQYYSDMATGMGLVDSDYAGIRFSEPPILRAEGGSVPDGSASLPIFDLRQHRNQEQIPFVVHQHSQRLQQPMLLHQVAERAELGESHEPARDIRFFEAVTGSTVESKKENHQSGSGERKRRPSEEETGEESIVPVVTPPSLAFKPMLLSLPSDIVYLNDLHCFMRHQFEFFAATKDDAWEASPGRKQRVLMKQVGIRCVRCVSLPREDRAKRAVCYPLTVSAIYESVPLMMRKHFATCEGVPPAVRNQYRECQRSRRRGITDSIPTYYSDTAKKMGLVDDTVNGGIRYVEPSFSPSEGGSAADFSGALTFSENRLRFSSGSEATTAREASALSVVAAVTDGKQGGPPHKRPRAVASS
jgi:hypothetical protein